MRKIVAVIVGLTLIVCNPAFNNTCSAKNSNNCQPLLSELNPIWEKIWLGPEGDQARFLELDNSSIYVAGDKISDVGIEDIMVTRCDLNGNPIWNITNKDYQFLDSMAKDDSYVYVVGEDSVGTKFFKKCNLDGNVVLTKTWGYLFINSIRVYNSEIYAIGQSYSPYDVLVRKYDLNWTLLWNTSWDNPGNDDPTAFAVDNSGIYVVGSRENNSRWESFMLKLDLKGNILWNMSWNQSLIGNANAITLDDSSVYVAGSLWHDISNGSNASIIKFDKNGDYIWSRCWDADIYDEISDLVVDDSYIYLTGSFRDHLLGGGYPCILKYDKNGTLLWDGFWKGWDDHGGWGASIKVDDSGIYICGATGWMDAQPSGHAYMLKTDLDGGIIVVESSYQIVLISSILIIAIIWIRRRL